MEAWAFSWGTGKKIPLQGKKKQVNIKDYNVLLAAFLGQIIQLL